MLFCGVVTILESIVLCTTTLPDYIKFMHCMIATWAIQGNIDALVMYGGIGIMLKSLFITSNLRISFN